MGIGSVLHASGECRPCRNIVAKQPCGDGIRCCFCHLPHEGFSAIVDSEVNADGHQGGKQVRTCKAQRQRYQKLVGRMETAIRADPFGWNIDQAELLPSMETN